MPERMELGGFPQEIKFIRRGPGKKIHTRRPERRVPGGLSRGLPPGRRPYDSVNHSPGKEETD